MKFIRSLLLTLLHLLILPIGLLMTAGIMWYTLPSFQTTIVGTTISSILSPTIIFWITIGSAILYTILFIVTRLCNKFLPLKLRNCFIHINTWTMGLVGMAAAIATFVLVNPLISDEVIVNIPKKIGIGICLIAIILFHMFSRKLTAIINRKIQSYENAKEINVVGRSSVVFINFLKLFELFFPEMVLLSLLCLCVSWNIACYFVVVLICSLIPVLGNIECDFATRRQAKRDKELADAKMADAVANRLK